MYCVGTVKSYWMLKLVANNVLHCGLKGNISVLPPVYTSEFSQLMMFCGAKRAVKNSRT
jgi:hypothetical protein